MKLPAIDRDSREIKTGLLQALGQEDHGGDVLIADVAEVAQPLLDGFD